MTSTIFKRCYTSTYPQGTQETRRPPIWHRLPFSYQTIARGRKSCSWLQDPPTGLFGLLQLVGPKALLLGERVLQTARNPWDLEESSAVDEKKSYLYLCKKNFGTFNVFYMFLMAYLGFYPSTGKSFTTSLTHTHHTKMGNVSHTQSL